jgi:hypothetical protein
VAKDSILSKIEKLSEVGSPISEVCVLLDLDALDAEQQEAHKRGAARGRAKLRHALVKAAMGGDARCAALLAANLSEGDTEDEIVKFRRLWRAQEIAEGGGAPT